MTAPDLDRWLVAIAWRLDRLRWVPRDVLAEIVIDQGECAWEYTYGDPPAWTGNDTADRELAARLCARCPVQDECLELELRTAGEQTAGVWGALAEDDRRTLYRYWRQRGERADDRAETDEDTEGGAAR
ncbi:WhiB family transcriptional regulator [Kibdelosporangium philippinense]|uniref:WhiB family transcriptional regulator n=1 Tax=Kibdelosporangium philippinense TaxID=211113 RepID=A0ABS8ZMR6_9PSEU|nr:WhiB family transcriptional regulator [Kibdelosporangium philippinense]MCE7009044.1 WhiB family transcriptional regulator [Kibdelosporangium philippinense]